MIVAGVVCPGVRFLAIRVVLAALILVPAFVVSPVAIAQAAQPDALPAEVSAGGGFVNSSSYEAGSYAFSVRRDGTTYLVTARHVAPRGALVYGAGGLLGGTAEVSRSRDAAYVRLDRAVPVGVVQIATSDTGAPVTAAVDDIASRGTIDVGQRVCHSGYAESTQDAGGFVCGDVVDVPRTCRAYEAETGCEITMRSDEGQRVGWLGDSGGPVWQSVGPGRIRLLGVFTSVSSPTGGPPTRGHFVPAFDVLDDLGGTPVRASS